MFCAIILTEANINQVKWNITIKYRNNLSTLGKFLSVAIICSSLFTVGCSQLSNVDSATVFERCKLFYSTQNFTEAYKYCKRAAKEGRAEAQFNLGLMFRYGQGVRQNYFRSFKWTKMAAEQGNATSQYNVGISYTYGQGVKQNYLEAVKWYQKAFLLQCL